MKTVAKNFFIVLLILIPSIASANNKCESLPNGKDICTIIQMVADQMSPKLPIKANKFLTLNTVIAFDNELTFGVVLDFTKEQIEMAANEKSLSMSQFKQEFKENIKVIACESGGKLINLGAVYNYHIQLNDSSLFTKVRVTSCN